MYDWKIYLFLQVLQVIQVRQRDTTDYLHGDKSKLHIHSCTFTVVQTRIR